MCDCCDLVKVGRRMKDVMDSWWSIGLLPRIINGSIVYDIGHQRA